jgi:hypothetical protein
VHPDRSFLVLSDRKPISLVAGHEPETKEAAELSLMWIERGELQ